MKKLVILLTILILTAPAMATITVSCSYSTMPYQPPTVLMVTINYSVSGETLPPRAFGLLISCDANGIIGTVTPNKTSYYTAPGTFNYDGTQVTTWGNPIVDKTNTSFIYEAGSLYASNDPCVGHRTAPPLSGTLLSFPLTLYLGKSFSRVTVTLDSSRGGVVREDPSITGNINITCGGTYECMKNPTVPASWYTTWVTWGKPSCWCFKRNCRGDIDGVKIGLYWVNTADLNILRAAINKQDALLLMVPNGICADLDRTKIGLYRVTTTDLNIIRSYINKSEANTPICDMTNYNFWTN